MRVKETEIERETSPVYPKDRASMRSEHAEALTALTDGQLQQFVQLLIGVIGWEAQLVKTENEPEMKKMTINTKGLSTNRSNAEVLNPGPVRHILVFCIF